VILSRYVSENVISYRATLKQSIILGPLYLSVWNRSLNFA
jgi:hypothetical protein